MNKFLPSLLWLTFAQLPLSAQTITPTERRQTIDSVLSQLNQRYVFPDVALKMEQHIRAKIQSYHAVTDGQELASRLTSDLQAVSHDRHLNVGYFAGGVPAEQVWEEEPTPAQRAAQQTFVQTGLLRENFGILDVSVLRYNIGYLNVKYLAPPEFAGESYTAALNYLSRTDALILDLRQCGGATSEHAIPFLCSYFFAEPTHLNDFYWRKGNRTQQSWTYTQVPGRRYLDKPIFVLTSRQTFSGAEELAYDLKNLKRATLIGETTGGGANPGGTARVNEHFSMFIPFGRAINPITQTNWEGVGVQPDTAVSSVRALYTARVLALRAIVANPGTDADWRSILTGQLADLTQNPPRFATHRFTLAGHPQAKQVAVVGSFNGWSAGANPLVREGNAWVGAIELEPGKAEYKFVVDGQWLTDPGNPRTEGAGQYVNSVLEVGAK